MADQELSLPPKSSASSAFKLLNLVEYYFSDLNLATTDNLTRFVFKDPQGFVPVSVVASLKKIKPLVTDHRQLAAVLHDSSKLVVSDDGKRVKRLSPISELDIEELRSRIVIAENLPKDQCRQNLMKVFSAAGSVKAIQTSASRSEKTGNICQITKLQAYVEYESTELAEKAVAELSGESNRRSDLRVRLMTKRTVVNRNKVRSKRKKKTKPTLNDSNVTPLARSERDEKADSVPISEHGSGTPPIQPSVSPEILMQSQHPRQVSLSSSLSSTTPGCFTYAAGHHVLSGVTDKRKCRPRGLLAVTTLSSSEDALFPYPSPSHASVQWRLSPSDASCKSYSVTPPLLSSRSSADIPYPLRSLGSADSAPSPLLSLGSTATISVCSSGNVIRTPASDSTPRTFASQLDSVARCLRLASVSPIPDPNDTTSTSVDTSFQFETLTASHTSADLTNFHQLAEGHGSCCSSQLGMVSSREMSLSQIYKADEELDCCRCLSDDEAGDAYVFDADVTEDKDRNIQVEGCRSGCAESITVDEDGLLASSTDSDWAFVLQKQ